jgi:hypothetical protein
MRPLDEADRSDDGGAPEEPAMVAQGQARWLANSPWWLFSAGIHAVLLLGASLFALERYLPIELPPPDFFPRREDPRVIAEVERPRDLFERKGVVKDDPVHQPTEEPALFFPSAELSDHNESANNEDFGQMKGQSKEFISYLEGQAGGPRGRQESKIQGSNEGLGVGGGAGSAGRYGGPFGGRFDRVARGTSIRSTPGAESAVIAALKWLARHQGADGGWGAEGFEAQCVGSRCGGRGERDYDTGVTGLSLLAFLGAGYTHLSRQEYPDPASPGQVLKFGEVVKKGIQWLMSHQDPEGCIGDRGPKYMYNHAIAALALTEAYGMTTAALLKEPSQKAVDFVVAAQNPGKGWRYSARSGDNDSSVTGWAVMVLKSAELSELIFPKTAYDGALAWFGEVTDQRGYYEVGYNGPGTGKVFVPGKNESHDGHPAMSAVAVMSRIFMQKQKNEPALGASQLLVGDLPEWKPNKIDFYYWYYASLALFQLDGPKGPRWMRWNEPMKDALVPHQRTGKDACRNGSWDPEVDRWGFEGGRVYAAAINALTLEVYYRYANVFGGTTN